jgi:hypothetical protein
MRGSNYAPAPNRRPRFPLDGLEEFECPVCAPRASPAAVGEAQRWGPHVRAFYWVLLISAQIWLPCELTLVPSNANKVSFRRQERAATFAALATNPSTANQAAMREELRSASRYITDRDCTRAGFLLASLLALDIVCAYAWSRHKRRVANP